MELKVNKGLDPYNCSIEEIKNAINQCITVSDDKNNQQMACKLCINSIYGALANQYYSLSNVDIAESITLQGQDLIKYAVNVVNYYFKNKWHEDYELHKKMADAILKKKPDYDVNEFLNLCKNKLSLGDTLQCAGDSVDGKSIIKTNYGDFTIEDLFKESLIFDKLNLDKIRVKSNKCVYAFDPKKGTIIVPIKYIMRHYVEKEHYVIKSANNFIEVTADHSIIINRNGEFVSIKPQDININTDKIIELFNDESKLYEIYSIENIGVVKDYVYDIEIDTENKDNHNFFANNILVHNTDSVSEDSIVKTEKHPKGITIKDFYDENINNIGDSTLKGHTSVNTDDKVLNWNEENNLYYGNVKRIIKHNVDKPKWRLKTKSGKIVECTDNHSLIVFRDGQQIHVKPNEIIKGDKVLSIIEN